MQIESEGQDARGPYEDGSMRRTLGSDPATPGNANSHYPSKRHRHQHSSPLTASSEEAATFEVSRYGFLRLKKRKSSTLFPSKTQPLLSHSDQRTIDIITFQHIQHLTIVLNRPIPDVSFFIRRQGRAIPNRGFKTFNLELRREIRRSTKTLDFATFVKGAGAQRKVQEKGRGVEEW